MSQSTAKAQAQQSRIAPYYDVIEVFIEGSAVGNSRHQFWSQISTSKFSKWALAQERTFPAIQITLVLPPSVWDSKCWGMPLSRQGT